MSGSPGARILRKQGDARVCIMILNGEEDSKYLEIGKRMKQLNYRNFQDIISNCSHNTHMENSYQFIDYLTSVSNPHDTCKACGDVIMYCKCYEDVIKEIEKFWNSGW